MITRTITAIVTGYLFGYLIFPAFFHIDVYPRFHTYGISVGTDSLYCSAEIVHGLPQLFCESAS